MLNVIDISTSIPVLFSLYYLHSPPFGGVGGGFWEASGGGFLTAN